MYLTNTTSELNRTFVAMKPHTSIWPNEERGKLVRICVEFLFSNYQNNISSTVTHVLKILERDFYFFLHHPGASYIIFGSTASTFTVFYHENLYLEDHKEQQKSEWEVHTELNVFIPLNLVRQDRKIMPSAFQYVKIVNMSQDDNS